MSLKEIEALARELSPAERVSLAKRWLAEGSVELAGNGGGHGANGGEQRGDAETLSIWGLGSSPVDCGVSDGSTNHDRYFYDSPDH
ncbi:MAG TPA: hypothetical protein VFJ16_27935 [Longimicrobium sp.]|nr:hypothetical protein [Longimicrobium sp.]